jgi:catalase
LFDQEQADKFDFDHLDPTKLIPEELIPLLEVGRMELDRYVDNFFAETEQVAFCPSHVVPGIDFSDDPLLQGRLFSYLDTQLSRLGTANFHQLPVNAPRCPFANFQRDGRMQMQVPKGRVNYEPSSLSGGDDLPPLPSESPAGFTSFAAMSEAEPRVRQRPPSFSDHYSQARQFYISQTTYEQTHIAAALVFELSKVETPHVRVAMVAHLRNIDEQLAERVAHGLGIETLPKAARAAHPTRETSVSDPLSIQKNEIQTLKGRSIGVLIGEGSDQKQLAELQTKMLAEQAHIKTIAPRLGSFCWSDGTPGHADAQLAGTPSVFFDAVILLLSSEGTAELMRESAATDFVRDAYGHLKAIGYTHEAKPLLDLAHVQPDRGVIAIEQLDDFLHAAKTRQWEREAMVRLLP